MTQAHLRTFFILLSSLLLIACSCDKDVPEEPTETVITEIPPPLPAETDDPRPTDDPCTTNNPCDCTEVTNGVGPAPRGLKINAAGTCVSWNDPCYNTLVLFGPEDSSCGRTVIPQDPDGLVVIPQKLLRRGCDRFNLKGGTKQKPLWALITAGTLDGQTVNEGKRGHAVLLTP